MPIFLSAFFCHIVKLLKKVIRIGETSCLLPIMDIFKDEDRKLMQTHCHFRALTILKSKQGDADIKEAIAYLSFAIIAAGRLIEILTAGLPLDPVLQLLGWTIIFWKCFPQKIKLIYKDMRATWKCFWHVPSKIMFVWKFAFHSEKILWQQHWDLFMKMEETVLIALR